MMALKFLEYRANHLGGNDMSSNGATAGKGTVREVHGLWATARTWEEWIDPYQRTLAPPR